RAEELAKHRQAAKDAGDGQQRREVGKPPEPPEAAETAAKPSDEKRGADAINALRWLEKSGIDGFVDWRPIDHPDFPGQKVEIGGFKPYVLLNPPAEQLDSLAEKHLRYLGTVAELMPRLKLLEPRIEAIGRDVFRVTATVFNSGYLPTQAIQGRDSRHVPPVQLAIDLPEGMQLATGTLRTQLRRMTGRGG